jgi:hypothetical protein
MRRASIFRMPSGAGHDAQMARAQMPAAMMFVPSIGGISHHWSENTSDEDLVLGAQVFTDAIAEALKALVSEPFGVSRLPFPAWERNFCDGSTRQESASQAARKLEVPRLPRAHEDGSGCATCRPTR